MRKYVCASCRADVSLSDNYCPSCGGRFIGDGVRKGGGAAAGKLEIANVSLNRAREWSLDQKFDPDKELDNFATRYVEAQKLAKGGNTRRKDMPVLEQQDMRAFQQRLRDGNIDHATPFAKNTVEKDPFPEGLSGKEATKWLKNGLRDGDEEDDKVIVSQKSIKVGDLIPIQKQIYLDKTLGGIIRFGVEKSIQHAFHGNLFVVSSDNRIIDGHHRWLIGFLIDPQRKVKCLVVDLPIAKLLPLSVAYGDAIGNKRNQ